MGAGDNVAYWLNVWVWLNVKLLRSSVFKVLMGLSASVSGS